MVSEDDGAPPPRPRFTALRKASADATPPWPASRHARLLYATMVAAGPVSLVFFPQPAGLVFTLALVGAIAGLLYIPRTVLPGLAAVFVLLFGVDYVTQAALTRSPQLVVPLWQPYLIASTTWLGVPWLARVVMRARKTGPDEVKGAQA